MVKQAAVTKILQEAEALSKKGAFAAASALLQELLDDSLRCAGAHVNEGVLQYWQGKLEVARFHFVRALQFAKQNTQFPLSVAEADHARESIAQINAELEQGEKRRKATISVIVPTYKRGEKLRPLIQSLIKQDLDPSIFEVIVVDDGSHSLSDVRSEFRNCGLRLKWHELGQNGGPARARNIGMAWAEGEIYLFLNDDAIAEENLLSGHLLAHEEFAGVDVPIAILGAFPYHETARREPLVRAVEQFGFSFDFPNMVHRNFYPWGYFWTCNLSMRAEQIMATGGFDEDFKEAMAEDVELGRRLGAESDFAVQYRSDLVVHHDHTLDLDGFMRRQEMFGRAQYRMFRKYGDIDSLIIATRNQQGQPNFSALQDNLESWQPAALAATAELRAWSAQGERAQVSKKQFEELQNLTRCGLARGILDAHDQWQESPALSMEKISG